jgi:hypothetical protein
MANASNSSNKHEIRNKYKEMLIAEWNGFFSKIKLDVVV